MFIGPAAILTNDRASARHSASGDLARAEDWVGEPEPAHGPAARSAPARSSSPAATSAASRRWAPAPWSPGRPGRTRSWRATRAPTRLGLRCGRAWQRATADPSGEPTRAARAVPPAIARYGSTGTRWLVANDGGTA